MNSIENVLVLSNSVASTMESIVADRGVLTDVIRQTATDLAFEIWGIINASMNVIRADPNHEDVNYIVRQCKFLRALAVVCYRAINTTTINIPEFVTTEHVAVVNNISERLRNGDIDYDLFTENLHGVFMDLWNAEGDDPNFDFDEYSITMSRLPEPIEDADDEDVPELDESDITNALLDLEEREVASELLYPEERDDANELPEPERTNERRHISDHDEKYVDLYEA
jgi:hypothetical protein